MSQIFKMCQITISALFGKSCLKSIRNITSDRFLTHLSSFVDTYGVWEWQLAPSCSDIIRAKILDIGYGKPCGHLHNLSPKSLLGFYRCRRGTNSHSNTPKVSTNDDKCVRNVSEVIFLTDFKQFSQLSTYSFLTHL